MMLRTIMAVGMSALLSSPAASLVEDPVPLYPENYKAPNEVITAVTLIHGIPGKEQDLEQHLLSLARPTRSEPGCVAYDLYQSPEQKHEFMRYEIWSSPDALEAHKKTPHLRASFEKRQKEGWTTQITVWKRVIE